MGQCGITSSKTVLVFLNLIFWVSPAVPPADGGSGAPGRSLAPRALRASLRSQGPLPPPYTASVRVFKLFMFNGRSEPLRAVWGFSAGRSPFPRSPPELQGGGKLNLALKV